MPLHSSHLVSTEADRLFGEIAEVRRKRRERFERDMASINSDYDFRVESARDHDHPGPVIRAVIVAWAILMLVLSILG
ncbi:hypothetical protein NG895_29555 [Aeoliella sp. ICT_H6.2]|uniref:Uncharacterized protein n=1 Tax=Aeoliella straminimaris TaxID=2954799 RepID=A0A9X2FGQ5_9BACT|nr:hypothetical protein [Aeoliella straminimaris]MCO6048068.1 hypothetical protein [Aeoliella straminimaris]